MVETESAASPRRLARITAVQAIETITETALFGTLGLFFGLTGLYIAIGFNAPGAIAFEEYLLNIPDFAVYISASSVFYVAFLVAMRTRIQAGISSLPTHEEDEPESRIESTIKRINSMVSFSSYTAAIIVIGGILTYEVMATSPLIAIVVLIGYHYYEHSVLAAAIEGAESLEDASSPITPAVLGAALIAMVMMLAALPILGILRIIGLIASVREYVPSFEHVTSSIRHLQEHSIFMGRRGKFS